METDVLPVQFLFLVYVDSFISYLQIEYFLVVS